MLLAPATLINDIAAFLSAVFTCGIFPALTCDLSSFYLALSKLSIPRNYNPFKGKHLNQLR
jgi:hypothetical protein